MDRTELTPSQKGHLNALKSSASNILFLVAFSIWQSLKSVKYYWRQFHLACKVIENAISILNSKALDNNVDVKFIVGNKIPENILGDAFRFQQIIVNLLDNAIKYAPGGFASTAKT